MPDQFKRICLIACCVAAISSVAVAQRRNQSSRHGWTSNYRQALQTARETKKPLMVLFRCIP